METPQTAYVLPFWGSIPGGFPSPAQGYEDDPLDLHALLVRHPAATFFMTVRGDHLKPQGIRDGSIIVIDRSVTPKPADFTVMDLDGERVIRRLSRVPTGDCQVWGKVTAVVTQL